MAKTWAYSMQIKYTRNNHRIRVESLGYHSKSVKCKPNKKRTITRNRLSKPRSSNDTARVVIELETIRNTRK